MPEITFAQLEAQHATNERRQELLTCFKDELDSWRDYLAELRVWLFGSYLTDKEQPNDIDILLAGKLKPGTPFPPKLPRKPNTNVHVISIIGTGELSTKDQLVQKFNAQEGNAEKNIQLSTDDVADLLL